MALWVVLGHFWDWVVELFPGAEAASPFTEQGHAAVPAFFLLSGWVLSHNYADAFARLRPAETMRFLALRFARIYPLHLAMLLVVGLLVLVARWRDPAFSLEAYGMGDLALNLLLLHAWTPHLQLSWNYPSWSISSEWFAYILFPFAARWYLRNLSGPVLPILSAAVFLALACLVVVLPLGPFHNLALVSTCFLAGASLHWIALAHARWTPPSWLPDALLASLPLIAFLPFFEARWMLFLVVPGILILALRQLGTVHAGWLWTSSPARILGQTSYSLYLSHAVAQKVIAVVLPPERFADSGIGVRLLVVAGWILCVGLGTAASFLLVEEPARRWIRRLLERRRPAT